VVCCRECRRMRTPLETCRVRAADLSSDLSAEINGSRTRRREDVGGAAAEALLDQIGEGGVVDAANQPTALLLMSLGPEDVSQVRLGPLTPFAMDTLRLIHDFFGVAFHIEADPTGDSLLLTCRGVGFRNSSKRVT
jgi:RNA 3'-terminal phosphate cyclase-like protein